MVFTRTIFLLGVSGLLLAGCGGDADAPTEKPAATKQPAPAAPAEQPLQASVFLEYSGGMRGFMPAGNASTPATEFQRRLSSLLTETKVSGTVAERQYFLLDKAGQPQAQPFGKLLQTVEGLNPAANLGTELPQMLESIMARPAAAQQVSVVISDFIYGPQVKADFAVLPELIRAALVPVSQQQLAVAVLGEKSHFYGTYHPAVKTPVSRRQLTGELVPYYIWLIGPPAQVSRYLTQVVKNPPAEQAYFGLTLPAPAARALLAAPELKPSGAASLYNDPDDGQAAQHRKLAVSDLDSGPVEFSLGLNLSDLPPAWQQPDFLQQHLLPQLPQGQVSLLRVQPLTASQRQSDPALAAYTHAVRLRLTRLPGRGAGTLALRLPAPETPAWVAAWTTANDNLPTGRTFALDQVLRGVRDCYPAALPSVFSVEFSVRKDD